MARTSIFALFCTVSLCVNPLAASTKIEVTPNWYRHLMNRPFRVTAERATRDAWWPHVDGFQFDGHNPAWISRRPVETLYPVDFDQSVHSRRAKLLKRGALVDGKVGSGGEESAVNPTDKPATAK